MSPPSSPSKNKPSKKAAWKQNNRLAEVSNCIRKRRDMEDSNSVSFKSPAWWRNEELVLRRTVQPGSPRGHVGPSTLPLSGHQLCPLRPLNSPKQPRCRLDFPPLPLPLHSAPHAHDPHDFSPVLLGSLPTTLLLVIEFLSSIGSLGYAWQPVRASQRELTCYLPLPSRYLFFFSFGSIDQFRPWPPPWNFPFHFSY
jgi:hypothetical protein